MVFLMLYHLVTTGTPPPFGSETDKLYLGILHQNIESNQKDLETWNFAQHTQALDVFFQNRQVSSNNVAFKMWFGSCFSL